MLLNTEQLKAIMVDHKSQRPFLPRGLINRGNMCYVHTVSLCSHGEPRPLFAALTVCSLATSLTDLAGAAVMPQHVQPV